MQAVRRAWMVWRPVAIIAAIALLSTLLWRRTHPLTAVAVAFGGVVALDLATLSVGRESASLFAMFGLAVLPYSLFRWGSGRQATTGFAVMVGSLLMDMATYGSGGALPLFTGVAFLLFPSTLGASVRYWNRQRTTEIAQVRVREREQLARELHDTVAHHVSAIAIQAQAGRAMAASRPDTALEVFATIESEASRTLAEMRGMVGILRDGAAAELAPRRGVHDIPELARNDADRPRIDVHVTGELDGLRPAVDSTVYRLAQESVTNALRHARNASVVDVLVAADEHAVRLVVTDDGERPSHDAGTSSGFGLVGMAERASLVGGTLDAGPGPRRGWAVHAMIPRNGSDT